MKILILTQYYPPETGAPQNRLSSLATNMKSLGASVEILTAFPNYPSLIKHKSYRYKIKSNNENIDGINVHRTYIYANGKSGFIYRLVNYFSFVFSSLIYGIFKTGRYDVIICESPPLFLGITSIILKKIKNARLVLNISDLWPLSIERLGVVKNKFLLNIAYRLEKFIYKRSDYISAQTEGIKRYIENIFPNKKILLFRNGIDVNFFRKLESQNLRLPFDIDHNDNDLVITYTGNFGYAQGLERIVSVAKKIESINKNIKFILIGDGPLKNRISILIKEKKISNVAIHGSIDRKYLKLIWEKSDIALIPIIKNELFKGAIPSKIFEALYYKKPILTSLQGEAYDIFISRANCGVWFDIDSDTDIINKILNLYMNHNKIQILGNNGHNFIIKNFDRTDLIKEFYNFINNK